MVVCVILCKEGLECAVTQTVAALEPNICGLKIVVILWMSGEYLLCGGELGWRPGELEDEYNRVRPLMELRVE